MNQVIKKRNENRAQTIIKGLTSRNMTGYYVGTLEEAKNLALSLIPEGSTIAMGGSQTVIDIGLLDVVKNGNYKFVDRKDHDEDATEEAKRAAEIAAFSSDVFLGSTNAMTDDGILVNIDGNANRVSAYAYGPKKLILIVGMNKVTADLDSAMKRARSEAATINASRFGLSTPCSKTGTCMDCKSPETICCQFLITRYSRHKDRIHVILVDEPCGF